VSSMKKARKSQSSSKRIKRLGHARAKRGAYDQAKTHQTTPMQTTGRAKQSRISSTKREPIRTCGFLASKRKASGARTPALPTRQGDHEHGTPQFRYAKTSGEEDVARITGICRRGGPDAFCFFIFLVNSQVYIIIAIRRTAHNDLREQPEGYAKEGQSHKASHISTFWFFPCAQEGPGSVKHRGNENHDNTHWTLSIFRAKLAHEAQRSRELNTINGLESGGDSAHKPKKPKKKENEKKKKSRYQRRTTRLIKPSLEKNRFVPCFL